MRKQGFSLVEVAMAVLLLALILAALFKTFSSGQKMAGIELQNHTINDETQKIVLKLMDEIRSANRVDAERPGFMAEGIGMTDYTKLDERDSANPENEKNKLVLTRLKYDFTKDPPGISKMVATYSVVKDPSFPTNKGALMIKREAAEFDDKDVLVSGPKTTTIADSLDAVNFYRIMPAGASNVFFRIIMSRQDKSNPTAQLYTAKMVSSAKVRGAEPEGVKPTN